MVHNAWSVIPVFVTFSGTTWPVQDSFPWMNSDLTPQYTHSLYSPRFVHITSHIPSSDFHQFIHPFTPRHIAHSLCFRNPAPTPRSTEQIPDAMAGRSHRTSCCLQIKISNGPILNSRGHIVNDVSLAFEQMCSFSDNFSCGELLVFHPILPQILTYFFVIFTISFGWPLISLILFLSTYFLCRLGSPDTTFIPSTITSHLQDANTPCHH